MEHPDIEGLAAKLVKRIESLVLHRSHRWDYESALNSVLSHDEEAQEFSKDDLETLEMHVRRQLHSNSMERARLSASSGKATGFVGGRIPPKPPADKREKFDWKKRQANDRD